MNEAILFKNILESEKVTNKINENRIDKERYIYKILSYLNFIRKEKSFDVFLSSYFSCGALPVEYLKEKKHLPMIAVNTLLYSIFFQKGYLYHVTNTRNVDSILEQGLITLNKKFDQNLFIQVEEVNQCWKAIAKRNKIYKGYNTLIEIPGYKEVMNTRFESVYLSNDLTSALGLYGDESEIYKDFLQKLINTFDLSKDIYLPQEVLQQVITSKAHNLYKIEVKEWDCIIQFFNSLYEPFEEENRQSIILVPIQNINNQYMYSSQYDNLRKEPYDFSFRYTMCSDIEYRKNISKEGLIAIDILEDTSKKVKLKVREKDLNL